MSKISWYTQRLRSMSSAELVWRVGKLAKARSPLRHRAEPDDATLIGAHANWDVALDRFRGSAAIPNLLNRSLADRIAVDADADTDRLLRAADAVADFRFQFFGYPEVRLPQPIDWNLDPVADVRWPSVAASKIDHRTAPGDVKWIWELNRLQHLPWLAQAWLLTGERRYSEAVFDQLDSWMDQNPPGRGIAWRGSFEAGVRAISVGVAVVALRDSPDLTAVRYRRIVRMLAASGQYCWDERSRFSSANNHLIGELAGLATVSILFPELPKAAKWESRAVAELAREADLQILADGMGAEQAVGYQIFTAELLLVVAALLRARDGGAPREIVDAIDRGACFLALVVGDEDPAPRFGDDDEGFALRLGPEPVRTVRDHLAIAGAFTRGAAPRRCGHANLTAAWYGGIGETAGRGAPEKLEHRSFFAADGGLVVLRSGRRRLTMDVGSLGYLSIAAHGHADALGVTLAVDGVEIVGDPGAGSYYGNPDWRPIHRGTRAHGTVEVDGEDQSIIGGPFLWVRHARTTVHGVDLDRGIIDAEHDGYRRLAEPVVHRRWLIAPPGEREVLVVDSVTGQGRHSVRTSWPLHPDLRAVPEAGGHTVYRDNSSLVQIVAAANAVLVPEQVRGNATNNLGWWSGRLESRVPASWIGAVTEGAAPIVTATVLNPVDDSAPRISSLEIVSDRGSIDVSWKSGGNERRVAIDTTSSAAVQWHPGRPSIEQVQDSDHAVQPNEVS